MSGPIDSGHAYPGAGSQGAQTGGPGAGGGGLGAGGGLGDGDGGNGVTGAGCPTACANELVYGSPQTAL